MRVTFGRYQPKSSFIHSMDARFKMIVVILFMICIFLPVGLAGYLICSVVILIFFALSKLNFRMLLNLFPPVIFVFVIIFFINALLTHPSNEITNQLLASNNPNLYLNANGIGKIMVPRSEWFANMDADYVVLGYFYKIGSLWISEKAFYVALMMSLRIYFMIALTCVLTGTTSPLQLTLAIEDILSPLKWIGIPIYIISMIISIALRMIPTLIDEAGRIIKAQSSRGIDIKNGKIMDKLKGMASLIIPLLVSAFQKAEDLAYAMESRGYDPYSERTRYIKFKFRFFDLFMLLFAIAFLGLMIVTAYTDLSFISAIHIPHVDDIIKYPK